MTKMKSKKMTKSTFAIIIMAIAMVAMLAFGGTYAYFTATTTDIAADSLTTGTINLKAGDTVSVTSTVTENFLPYDTLKTSATYTDLSNRANYIFFTVTGETKQGATVSVEIVENGVKVDNAAAQSITDGSDTIYYIHVTDAVAKTNGTQGKAYAITVELEVSGSGQSTDGTADVNAMGVDITVTYSADSIQDVTEGGAAFSGAAAAWAALKAQLGA